MGEEPEEQLRLTLRANETAPGRAREAARALAAHLTPGALDDLELVISELVTNAVMHGRGATVGVLLQLIGGGRVRGEVTDDGAGRVALRPDMDERGGMGLRLVDAVAQWGVVSHPTRVWFELPPPAH
jgi:anti-sigma regulatory factor (Ser/Thr protein kinase)